MVSESNFSNATSYSLNASSLVSPDEFCLSLTQIELIAVLVGLGVLLFLLTSLAVVVS